MITAIDTNVLVALWDRDDTLNSAAQAALDAAFTRGKLVISGAVFAELLAFPRRTEAFLDQFLTDTGIAVDWGTDESIWRVTGKAFQKCKPPPKTEGRSSVPHPGGLPDRGARA